FLARMLMVPFASMRMKASGRRGAAAWAGVWAARGLVYRPSSIPPPATEVILRKDRRSISVVFTGASRSHDVITAARQRQTVAFTGRERRELEEQAVSLCRRACTPASAKAAEEPRELPGRHPGLEE